MHSFGGDAVGAMQEDARVAAGSEEQLVVMRVVAHTPEPASASESANALPDVLYYTSTSTVLV